MAAEPISKTPSLPPYSEMIMGAIDALNKKEGSNKSSIRKHIEATYEHLPVGHTNSLTENLNKLKEDGELVLVKNNYMRPNPNGPPKRGRGRPPKVKGPHAPETPVGVLAALAAMPTTVTICATNHGVGMDGPSRGRGRPQKDPNAPPKRGRGRPRKVNDQNAFKTHVAAPPALLTAPTDVTTSVPSLGTGTNGPSRGRGRPRKDPNPPPKRGRGRPRKANDPNAPKTHVAAPPALVAAPFDVTSGVSTLNTGTNGPSRGRGRPRKDHNAHPSAKKEKTEKLEEPTPSKSGRPRGRPRKIRRTSA